MGARGWSGSRNLLTCHDVLSIVNEMQDALSLTHCVMPIQPYKIAHLENQPRKGTACKVRPLENLF